MEKNYARGRSYCWVLDRFLYRDILHDGFINYHKKTGRNLFEEHISTVLRTLKLTYLGYYINKQFVKNRHNNFVEFENQSYTKITPEDQVVGSDLYNNLVEKIKKKYPKSSKKMIASLDLVHQGYQQQEAAEELGFRAKSSVAMYFMNIKKLYNESR